MSWKNRGGGDFNSRNVMSRKLSFILCIGCFCAGMLFTDRMWPVPEAKGISRSTAIEDEKLKLVAEGCNPRIDKSKVPKEFPGEVSKPHHTMQSLDKTISNLEMELAAARAVQDSILTAMNGVAADTHVSAVILDLDGTLLNTEVITKDVLNDLLARYGKTVDQKKESMRLGMTHKESRLAIIKDYDLPMTPEQFSEELMPMYQEKWLLAQALPGANRLIKHLHNQKVPFALASNSMTKNVQTKVSHQPGWRNYFKIVLGSDQVKSGKPSPDIFLEAANRMGVDAARCLVIEDSLIGVKAGKAAGMKVVAVPSLQSESGQFSIADLVLYSLLDLQPEVWGLPPFEDWVSGALPIEPIYVSGLYKNGLLHELAASSLPDQVCGCYFGWAKIEAESSKILKILMSIKWDGDCSSSKKVIHVCLIDGSNEIASDQKMQIMLVGYIGGQSNKGNASGEKEILEGNKAIARTALDSSAFTHHSCTPYFSAVVFENKSAL